VAPQIHLVDAADGVLALRPSLTQMAAALAGRIRDGSRPAAPT